MQEGQLDLHGVPPVNPVLWYGRDGVSQRTDHSIADGYYVLFYRKGWIYIAV